MCGIAGVWARAGSFSADGLLAAARAMGDALRQRGPDGEGQWSDPETGIALAHRRLSVVDLSQAGAQPMASACGRYVLVFNGEIYNHRDLRLQMERPTAWRGHGDTETLLELIARVGLADALRASIGAFALALWDRRDRVLSLARDRMGEKPLYYGWSEGRLVFASQLRALRVLPGFRGETDPVVLGLYLRHNAVPAPWSILKGIGKLRPGQVVTIGTDGDGPAPHREHGEAIWSLEDVIARPVDAGEPEGQVIDRMEQLLADAVSRQMEADVPVGAFLSGGIDSSLITALMCAASPRRRVKTFSIGFHQAGFDEAPFARAVAAHLGTDHHELYLEPRDILDRIADVPQVWDEPFADSSQLPMLMVSAMAREHVTVALSGDGGDELFCGYNRYLVSRRHWDRLRALSPGMRGMIARGIMAVPPAGWDRLGMPLLGSRLGKVAHMLRGDLSVRAIHRASSEEWGAALPLVPDVAARVPRADGGAIRGAPEEQMMQWDMAGYLTDDILVKVDRASMANGLEARVPFLDHRVIEAAWALPLAMKRRGGQGKWVLRRVLARHVPEALFERPKAGFAVPVGQWLRRELRDWAEDLLSPGALQAEPAFDIAPIRRRWQQHLAGTHDWTGSLWGVLMYQAWAREGAREGARERARKWPREWSGGGAA